MKKTLQELEDFAIKRRDDRASDFATQKYWAAYLDGIRAAKNSSDVLGSENAEVFVLENDKTKEQK